MPQINRDEDPTLTYFEARPTARIYVRGQTLRGLNLHCNPKSSSSCLKRNVPLPFLQRLLLFYFCELCYLRAHCLTVRSDDFCSGFQFLFSIVLLGLTAARIRYTTHLPQGDPLNHGHSFYGMFYNSTT